MAHVTQPRTGRMSTRLSCRALDFRWGAHHRATSRIRPDVSASPSTGMVSLSWQVPSGLQDGSARTECWADGRSSSSQSNHPLDKNRIGVGARSATRREDHLGVGVGNVQVSVHTSRARKRVSNRAMTVEGAEMDDKEACRFRALAARLNYLPRERPDLLCASKRTWRNMARPRSEDWLALKRVGRYLKRATRMVQHCHWTGDDTNLQGHVGSDLAGDGQNMKSTSSGVIMRSGHCMKAWSTSQSALALASREAELYAMTEVDSSAQWRIQHGQRLWRELDRSCDTRLQQCNRDSSKRWLGRSVPTYQGAVLVDPVKDQGWVSQVTKSTWDEQRG